MAQTKFWSKAYCWIPANLQDFILGVCFLDENLRMEMTFVMVFSNEWDDISDKVVDQATYAIVLVICMWMTFLTFGQMCVWRWNFILLWCSSILLLPSLDKIDEILALSSLDETCPISCPTFWVGWSRLGLILPNQTCFISYLKLGRLKLYHLFANEACLIPLR